MLDQDSVYYEAMFNEYDPKIYRENDLVYLFKQKDPNLQTIIDFLPSDIEWGYTALAELAEYMGRYVTEETQDLFIKLLNHDKWFIREGALIGLDHFLNDRFTCELEEDEPHPLPKKVKEALILFYHEKQELMEMRNSIIELYFS